MLLDDDSDEGELDEDPSASWYENLPPFPYVHVFFDSSMDAEDCKLGPWLCIHGHYGKSRGAVEEACARDS